MARKVAIVTGIPGVGKTTVCKETEALAAQEGIKLKVLNFGDVMVEIMERSGRPLHRDRLRKMDISSQKVIQAQAAAKLAKAIESADEHVIIDTHMIIRTGTGYLPGLPKHVLDVLKPDFLVLIETDPEEIAARRTKDLAAGERLRDVRVMEELKEELEFSRMVASACSVLTGAPVVIIKNPTGGQKEAAKALLELFRG
ncbi:adenylate kinase [Candidatus Bathyarchaeota archaeon ex4484_135]|nr:MAG: adenylate kinase [Candidatus Bathyarchaeota archaeon ex4484_135]